MRVSNSDYRAKKEIPWEILAPSFNTRCVARCPGPLTSRGCFKSYIIISIHVILYRRTEKGGQTEKKGDRLALTLSEACWKLESGFPHSRRCVTVCEESMIALNELINNEYLINRIYRVVTRERYFLFCSIIGVWNCHVLVYAKVLPVYLGTIPAHHTVHFRFRWWVTHITSPTFRKQPK